MLWSHITIMSLNACDRTFGGVSLCAQYAAAKPKPTLRARTYIQAHAWENWKYYRIKDVCISQPWFVTFEINHGFSNWWRRYRRFVWRCKSCHEKTGGEKEQTHGLPCAANALHTVHLGSPYVISIPPVITNMWPNSQTNHQETCSTYILSKRHDK